MSYYPSTPMETIQRTVSTWVSTRFGNKCLLDKQERAMRVVEEAMELAQSVGINTKYRDDKAKAELSRDIPYEILVIAKHVFSRPDGEPAQEHAGVLVSLLASATANGISLEEVTNKEIERIRSIPLEKILEKQAFKNRAGITKYTREPNGTESTSI